MLLSTTDYRIWGFYQTLASDWRSQGFQPLHVNHSMDHYFNPKIRRRRIPQIAHISELHYKLVNPHFEHLYSHKKVNKKKTAVQSIHSWTSCVSGGKTTPKIKEDIGSSEYHGPVQYTAEQVVFQVVRSHRDVTTGKSPSTTAERPPMTSYTASRYGQSIQLRLIHSQTQSFVVLFDQNFGYLVT
jgi:hypothetical protein